MSKFTAYQFPEAKGALEKVEKAIEEPTAGRVRVKVHACGACHADCYVKGGGWPGLTHPRVPGHEIAGEVDAVGPGGFFRVGLGWCGGHCGQCRTCRRGEFVTCPDMPVTGIHYDGGYGQFVMANANALAAIPDGLSYVEAAPLLCAGVTTFNGLRTCKLSPGEVVAVQGVGGLGHLAIQFANKMGYRVVVFSRGTEKRQLAMQLGAHHYFDTNTDDIVAETAKLGGVQVLLATSTNPKAMSAAFSTLGPLGTMLVLGAGADDICVSPAALIGGKKTVKGHASGVASDSEDTMKFVLLTGVRSMNEVFPFEKTAEAYDRMMSGDAKFRVVIDYDA
eukprot:jgi/Mesen1/9339/ME000061S08780